MFKIVCAFAVLAVTTAMIQCPENYCDTVDCAPPANCDSGVVKERASVCGCCAMCITQLAEGDSCARLFMLGVPPTYECGDGLECSRATWKCEKVSVQKRAVGACSQRQSEIQTSQANGLPLLGVEEPKCDADGSYSAVQCLGSVCFCVDKAGNEISGYQVNRANSEAMNCQCARDLADYMASGLIGKLFNCDINGNYKMTQAPVLVVTTPKVLLTGGQSLSLTNSNGGVFGEVAE